VIVWSYLTDGDPALATVVGVLVEVPVMLSVCSVCNATRHWFEPGGAAADRAPGRGDTS
jgi:ACR3 family arsenite efflux pump ArsB